MVDLHESLRPSGTSPPRPIGEIAADAKRRQRRRAVATTGTVVATLVVGVFAVAAVLRTPAEVTTITDGAATERSAVTTLLPDGTASEDTELLDDSTLPEDSAPSEDTAPSDDTAATENSAASGDATPSEEPVTTPGIRVDTTTTSEWDGGYCVQIEIVNETDDQQTWQLVLERDGTVASLWNASVTEFGETFVFAGEEGYNTTLEPRADTSFGTCIHT